jgi:hypothetical protein
VRLAAFKTRPLAVCFFAVAYASVSIAGEVSVVRFSKSELESMPKETDFIRSSDLGDVLSSKFKQTIVTLTQRQAGSNTATRTVIESWRPSSRAVAMRKLSTLAVSPNQLSPSPNEDLLRETLSRQSRKAIEVTLRNQFPIIETIRNGMKFSLNLRNPVESLAGKIKTPDIRYGLVESEIIPATQPIAIAALGTMSDLNPEFGSPAKVIYTIDKLSDDATGPVFTKDDHDDQVIQNSSLWSRMPSSNVNIKVDAADQDAVMADQVSTGALPGAKFTLSQADGFFSTQFVAGGKSDLKKSMVHQVQAPLYGEMSIARQFNYKMKPIHTSALNVLGDSKLPRVNLTYVHSSARAKGELVVKNARSEMSVIAEPRQGWSPTGQDRLGLPGDKISVAFSKTF